MLITTCTSCGARFRVTPVQLNAKQGQVRCGKCRTVFNGFEALERHPDDDTGSRLLAAREAAERASEPTPLVEPLPYEDLPDIETLGPAVAAPEPPRPESVEAPDPTPPPSHRAPRGAWRPSPSPSHEEVTLPPPPAVKRPARAWTFGVVLLALLLAAELAYAYRGPIAQRYPVLRPWLEAVCAAAGCSISWAREDALLKLEDSELLEIPGKPSEIALNARVRNLAQVAQEYPHLELTLTDLTGQAAVRRVLRPTDYLGRPVAAGEVLGPGAELSIQIRLETPRIKATGYELLLFYP
jgi:predicted Zn finger-like uncharacterized protein